MSDQQQEGDDHFGQDGGRETVTAGEAQRTPGGLGPAGTQDLPAMSQNDASVDEKLDGIVAQTRVDVGDEDLDRIGEVLRQRLGDTGIDLPDDRVAELAREVKGAGGAGGGGGSGV